MIYIPFGITFIYLFLRAFMKILGIWDGHDAGAAIIEGRKVLFAANEERYTKRKLDVGFPYNSIISALYHTHTKPEDIEHVAFSTTELTKTLERVFPSMRSSYYMFRRRLTRKPRFDTFRHNLKYTLTGVGPLPLCREISSSIIGGIIAVIIVIAAPFVLNSVVSTGGTSTSTLLSGQTGGIAGACGALGGSFL